MPTNPQINPSRTTVAVASKEFAMDDESITVEVLHAAKLLENFFKEKGYELWIFGPLCSRKLLEQVRVRQDERERERNMVGMSVPHAEPQITPANPFRDMPMMVDERILHADQHPLQQINEGPAPIGNVVTQDWNNLDYMISNHPRPAMTMEDVATYMEQRRMEIEAQRIGSGTVRALAAEMYPQSVFGLGETQPITTSDAPIEAEHQAPF